VRRNQLGEHKIGDPLKLNWEFHTILLIACADGEFKTFLEMKIQGYQLSSISALMFIDTLKIKRRMN
jgi:hypothetical protein